MTHDKLRIISVTGAHSSVGKTTLCSILLKEFKGYGAIKFTKEAFYTSVTDNADVILQDNKDTAVLAASGAERVVWVQSSGDSLEEALSIALSKMNGLCGVIVEGNSPAEVLQPDVVIFVTGKAGEVKPSAEGLRKRADIIVINTDETTGAAPLKGVLSRGFRINLLNNTGETDEFFACVEKKLSK